MPCSKKLPLIQFDLDKIRSFAPCKDPQEFSPVASDWSGTVLDVLSLKDVHPKDKFWVVCREEFLTLRVLRLFAIACAKTVRKHSTDKKLFDRTLQVVTRFANDKATSAALSAAHYAAHYAARSVAHYAALSAADSAARSAAHYVAHYAALSAADSAAYSAASSAADSAYDDVYAKHCAKLVRILIKLIRENYRK